ncbi:MAG TPA: histidine kinase N-terminal 7TM domain-containing protein [Anaerolineae bacterium]|nr:histidine kinase N-terminal 7TM domain-containing protein [Anaerolineae bacterium]
MTPIVLFLFIPPLLLLALVPYTWRHRTTPGARSFLMLVVAVAAWGICYAMQLATIPDLAIKSFWSAAKYVGVAITPVVWFAFALEYTGHGEWLTRRRFAALFIIPAITSVMAFANPLSLMWPPLRLVTTDQFVTTDAPFGLWFWVHAAYSYLFILLGVAVLIRSVRRFPQMYQQQAGALVVAVVLPLLANFIFIVVFPLLANFDFISRSNPLLYLDLTSVAFTFSALLFAWALFRYRLLDVVPVARDAVVASMTDVVVVIDLQNRIVDINPAGQQALGRTAADIIGQPVERVFSNWSELVERYRDMPEVHEEIALPAAAGTGPDQNYFDLRVTPISDRNGRVTGRLIVLRDITQGRLAESLSDSEKRMRRRAAQLQTVAEVARATTSERNLAELLPLVTRLIGERFNFYHVAIFMLDKDGEYAVLQAASSEGGQQMLGQGHRMKVGTGIVGSVAGSGLARSVTDVDQDTAFVANPNLPLTRSEMALPLKVRNQVIGVLDVQSAQATAFAEEDAALLATLADQVATAIENAQSFERVATLAEENRRLLETSERAVAELNTLTRRLTAEGWEAYFTQQRGEIIIEDVLPEFITERMDLPVFDQAIQGKGLVMSNDDRSSIGLPITLRGEVIGTIGLEAAEARRAWSEDDVTILENVAERVSIALDNVRLFEQTQLALSETEQLYNIGVHINTADTFEDLLQAAITPSVATGASSAGIWLFELDEAERPARMEFAVSWTREGNPPLPLGTRLRVADYPSSTLWLNDTGQPSFIGNIEQDERVDRQLRVMFQRINIAATAFMPLTLGGRWVGLIIVSWREPHEFTAGEQRMYQSIASQVAVAVENRRLFEQVERRAQREARLNQIAQQLRQTTDIHSILQTATEQISLALDTSHAQARLGTSPTTPQRANGQQDGSEEDQS